MLCRKGKGGRGFLNDILYSTGRLCSLDEGLDFAEVK